MAEQSAPVEQHRRRRSPRAINLTPTTDDIRAEKEEKALSRKGIVEPKAILDPFMDSYAQSGLSNTQTPIQPPYNPNALTRLVQENFMLAQCIHAMNVNVVGHGYRWEFIGEGDQNSAEAKAEQEMLDGLISRPNLTQSWQEMADASWADYENTGAFYWEVTRDQGGRIMTVDHLPAHSMRMTTREETPIRITAKLPRGGTIQDVPCNYHFRRFVQAIGNKRVYFREFGDPRLVDPTTGIVKDNIKYEDSATEVLYFGRYNPRSIYSVPRWINQVPAILGSRQAELTNMDFFSENAVPAMAVLVSGGQLTQDAVDELDSIFQQTRGRQAMNRVVILEVEGDPNAASEDGTIPAPKVDMKPLAGERQKEGQFLEYITEQGTQIRSAFRLPPLFIGLSEDINYATAKTSFEVAESQVFAPERRKFDDIVNMHILATWNPKLWAFRSQPARITDPEEIIAALTAFNSLGAMTPNIAIRLANEYFNLHIPEITYEWGNWPFAIVQGVATSGQLEGIEALMSQEAVERAAAAHQAFLTSVANPDKGDDNSSSGSDKGKDTKGNGNKDNEGDIAKAKSDDELFKKAMSLAIVKRIAEFANLSTSHKEAA